MSDNPFKAPGKVDYPTPNQSGFHGQQNVGAGYVNQVPVIAILMAVQGVFLLGLSVVSAGYGFAFANMSQWLPPAQRKQFEADMPPEAMKFIMIIAIVVAGAIGILAAMHFIAAYYNYQYLRRTFGMIVLGLGFLSVMTCYCAPTSIGLGVYGFIIFANPAVAHAFKLRKDGMSKNDMLGQFRR